MSIREIPRQVVEYGLKQGATDVVANVSEYERIMIRFSNNEVTVSKSFSETSVGIFVMIGKQRGGSTVQLGSKSKLEAEVKRLISATKLIPPADVYAPLPKGPFSYDESLIKLGGASINPEKLVGFVDKAIEAARSEGASKVAGSLISTKSKLYLATSSGVETTQDKENMEISVRAFASDVSSGQFVSIAKNEKDFTPEEAGRMAGQIAKASLNPEQGQAGRYTTLLGPMVFADLVWQVGTVSSAFLVDSGQSFLVDKIGSEVATGKFTLSDEPTLRESYGAKAFDDEGVPSRKNVIIGKGVLKTYLHNSTTAKKFKAKTTGNAGLISPVPWNLVVEAGSKSFEELLSGIDDGVYVTNDWYLRYQNYRTGDFSTIPRDGMFRIKSGEIKEPIRDLRISDNMIRIFKNIRELGERRFWIKWWEVEIPTLVPYAVVEDLNFTKSTM